METLRALILLPLGYLFLWPLVDRTLRHPHPGGEADASPLQIALTALALSVGLLTLAQFGLGLLPGRLLTPLSTLLVVLAGLGLGLVLNPGWLASRRWPGYWQHQWRALARLDAPALLALTLISVLAVILVNDLYYPFIGDDVLVRYGLHAKAIYSARSLPESVHGYPPLVPLSIVSTWFAAGSQNEHLARAFAAVMAAGTLGATHLAAREALGRTGGLLAAALVALTPVFIENATLLYTDIPTAFPLTLAFFYAVRWWRTLRPRDALLAGVLAGVALLTKQSALLWLAGLAALPVLRLIAARRELPPSTGLLWGWAAFLLPPLLIAGPWYARNALLGTEMLPVAGLYHLLGSGAGILGLVPSLAYPQSFGWPLALVFTAGWVVGLVTTARELWQVVSARRFTSPPDFGTVTLIAALFVIPYWLAWWTTFSFDPRFLLLILPLMALWSARPLLTLLAWLPARARLPRPAWLVLGAVVLAGLLLWGAQDRLGGVYRAVTQPLATSEARFRRVKPGLADHVLYARANLNPTADRLYLMDERLAYYLADFDYTVGYPLTLADLEGYDYLFHASGLYSVYGDGRLGWEDSEFYQHAFAPAVFEPVYESGGVHIMRILRTDLPPTAEEP